MRVTSSMYYKNVQAESSRANERLFDVNKQISSGLKIQYAHEDVTVFTQTMRLDNELTSLGQIAKSAENGSKMSDQADTVLNEFQTTMERTKVLLLKAANGAQSDTSRDAVAVELRGLEEHFKNLSNTSINGQFIFSGSAVDVRPISSDGTYMGNDVSMNAFSGAGVQQKYNLSGAELFLGEESSVQREITSNVVNKNLLGGASLTPDGQLRDLMGDKDDDATTNNTDYFYLRGTKSDGTAFNNKISLSDDLKISDLLTEIGKAYGNAGSLNVVNVKLNDSGEIVVEDKMKGSSKLDFHMVGAVDYSGAGAADIGAGNIDSLDSGENTYPPSGNLYVKEFIKSGLTSSSGVAIEGLVYDRAEFSKEGSLLSSNVPQIVRDTNAFASPSTKISEVADLSQGSAGTLDGTQFTLSGTNISGNPYSAKIDFSSAGSNFTIGGNTYDIFNMQNPRAAVDADEMTYQQLMDVTNMIVTGNLPLGFAETDYDTAIKSSSSLGNTFLSYDGKIQFQDTTNGDTKATLAIHDSNSGDFTLDVDSNGDGTFDKSTSSVMTFNTNNALTIKDSKTDFFKNLNEIITAVEENKLYPDSESGISRGVGMENAVAMLEDLAQHVSRSHSLVGAQSNALTNSLERTQLLEISTMTLRSSVIDTDLAEASLALTQQSLSYQAMLSTVAKISELSLVNYL